MRLTELMVLATLVGSPLIKLAGLLLNLLLDASLQLEA
jgi:hypothetical protein